MPTYEDCTLSGEERSGQGLEEIGEKMADNTRRGWIRHVPERCPAGGSCTYLISIVNTLDSDQILNARVESRFYDPGDVRLDKSYINTVPMGEFRTYEINPETNKDLQPFISKLRIKLLSVRGDADLFVSFSSANPSRDYHDFMSRRKGSIDQVTLSDEGSRTWLNRKIFFSVFGNTLSEYRVEFEYEFKPTFDERLSLATQLADSSPLHTVLEQERDDRFYSFEPWWTARENRTVVFLADVVFNKIYFYSMWQRYPRSFLADRHDVDDLIAIYGDHEHHHSNGRYYIRLRPDFALSALITDRRYIYNMYAFSQAPAANFDEREAEFETLELGVEQLGFVNGTRFQDYRYFQVDMDAIYKITVRRLPGRGEPLFYIKIMDADGWPGRVSNHHFRSEPSDVEEATGEVVEQTFVLDRELRDTRWPLCASHYHSLLGDGSQKCFISIGVTCKGARSGSYCAYKLKIEQDGLDNTRVLPSKAGLEFTPHPPGPILASQYTSGVVLPGEIKYYYFPVDYKKMGESLILLHK